METSSTRDSLKIVLYFCDAFNSMCQKRSSSLHLFRGVSCFVFNWQVHKNFFAFLSHSTVELSAFCTCPVMARKKIIVMFWVYFESQVSSFSYPVLELVWPVEFPPVFIRPADVSQSDWTNWLIDGRKFSSVFGSRLCDRAY